MAQGCDHAFIHAFESLFDLADVNAQHQVRTSNSLSRFHAIERIILETQTIQLERLKAEKESQKELQMRHQAKLIKRRLQKNQWAEIRKMTFDRVNTSAQCKQKGTSKTEMAHKGKIQLVSILHYQSDGLGNCSLPTDPEGIRRAIAARISEIERGADNTYDCSSCPSCRAGRFP